jgi:hypothetical protein
MEKTNGKETSRKSAKPDYSDIDIYEVLEQWHQVAIIWGTEDVLEVRPDLSDDQAWEVLQYCYRKHDCELGLTWRTIEIWADGLFPEPETSCLEPKVRG